MITYTIDRNKSLQILHIYIGHGGVHDGVVDAVLEGAHGNTSLKTLIILLSHDQPELRQVRPQLELNVVYGSTPSTKANWIWRLDLIQHLQGLLSSCPVPPHMCVHVRTSNSLHFIRVEVHGGGSIYTCTHVHQLHYFCACMYTRMIK